jgi:ABC-type sulfate/molybdate transport systems ATPase subunit
VTLDVGDGEFTILVGPSGFEKSAAPRMVAGLEEISDGEISREAFHRVLLLDGFDLEASESYDQRWCSSTIWHSCRR